LPAVTRDGGLVALGLEVRPERVGKIVMIFNDQDSERQIILVGCCRGSVSYDVKKVMKKDVKNVVKKHVKKVVNG
jgi:hypothetical protein